MYVAVVLDAGVVLVASTLVSVVSIATIALSLVLGINLKLE